MTTIGKRSSPKKNKSFKMKLSPKKYHSPKKTVKENKVKDHIAVVQKSKKAKGNAIKAKQISPSKPLSFRPKSRGLPKSTDIDIATKKILNISGKGFPEVRVPKQTKNMSEGNKKLSPLDATEDAVPSFEFCAEFGFTGKKAEVARTLIKVQGAFNRFKFDGLPPSLASNYKSTEFRALFRETAAMGSKVVSDFKFWDQFERGIIQLLEMRLAYYKVPRGTLFKSLGHKIASWNKGIYYAGVFQGPNSNSSIKIVPGIGMVRDLIDLAVTLHEQIEAVKEFDRVDGATEFAQNAGYY